jgi:hypothetical protein
LAIKVILDKREMRKESFLVLLVGRVKELLL